MKKSLGTFLIFLVISISFGGCAKKLVEKSSPPPPVWKMGKLIFIHETNSDYIVGVDTTGGDSQVNIEIKLTSNGTGKLPKKGDRIILKFYDGTTTAYAEDDVNLSKRKKESQ